VGVVGHRAGEQHAPLGQPGDLGSIGRGDRRQLDPVLGQARQRRQLVGGERVLVAIEQRDSDRRGVPGDADFTAHQRREVAFFVAAEVDREEAGSSYLHGTSRGSTSFDVVPSVPAKMATKSISFIVHRALDVTNRLPRAPTDNEARPRRCPRCHCASRPIGEALGFARPRPA
jgi:hypothetical protein